MSMMTTKLRTVGRRDPPNLLQDILVELRAMRAEFALSQMSIDEKSLKKSFLKRLQTSRAEIAAGKGRAINSLFEL